MTRVSTQASAVSTAGKPAGGKKWLAMGGLIASLVILGWVLTSSLSGTATDPSAASRSLTLMDSVTGEMFTSIPNEEGAVAPFENPKTGKRTLFPPESCYWTRDGKAKLEPTYVLLNEFVGKTGETVCPDCGRPVYRHNRMPPDDLMLKAFDEAEAKKKAGK